MSKPKSTPFQQFVDDHGEAGVVDWFHRATVSRGVFLVVNSRFVVLAVDCASMDEWFSEYFAGDLAQAVKLFPWPRRWITFQRHGDRKDRKFPFDKFTRRLQSMTNGRRRKCEGAPPTEAADPRG